VSLVRLSSVILSIVLVAGCSSGPPQCSGSEAQSVLKDMLKDQAKMLAVIMTGSLPLGRPIFLQAPSSFLLAGQGRFDDAFLAIEESVMGLPDEGYVVIAKQILVAARASTFELSHITTISQDELRSSCSVTVDYHLGLLSPEQIVEHIESDDLRLEYIKAFDAIRTLRVQREYDVFYSDDDEIVVELFDAE
jgi:hypothetical protein